MARTLRSRPHRTRRPALALAALALAIAAAAVAWRVVGGIADAQTPDRVAALGRFWDEHHTTLPPAPLVTHADVVDSVTRTVQASPDLFSAEIAGHSVEGRTLHHVWFGRGATHVLLWSQMHGDEPTATSALFDLMEWVRRERSSPDMLRLLDRLTVHLVPMLNPDGAQRYQRRNAQGIDVNRDALQLQTPEGRTLKALRDRFDPVLGFNLHNQNWSTSVGTPPKPASISLLAVAHDEARSDNPRRVLARKTAAVIRDAIEPFIPGQIGRYSDEFEVRAFGDNIARWGTGVVLIETGPLQGDRPDAALVRVNFVALVTALEALASGGVEAADPARYESLPMNGSRLLHTLVQNASVITGTGVGPFTADVGIGASRVVREQNGRREIAYAARIEDLGDLRVFGALETVDATGLTAAPLPDPEPAVGDVIELPSWERWKGPTLSVGSSGRLMLLEPAAAKPGQWRVVRIISVDSTTTP